MTVRVYSSTDASAPVLTGSNGTLITVLDAVLVNGYGSKTAAGWTKPFSATNKAVYRMATGGQNTGFYLNVQDNGPGAALGKEARVWGYQSASAQDTGVGQFPSLGQLPTGIIIRKSTTNDGVARAWTAVADGSMLYFFPEAADFVGGLGLGFAFGDIASYHQNDRFKCIIIGRNTENSNAGAFEGFPFFTGVTGAVTGTARILGHYMASNPNGIGYSVGCGKHVDLAKAAGGGGGFFGTSVAGFTNNPLFFDNTNYAGVSGGISMGNYSSVPGNWMPYPSGPDNSLWMSPIWVHHNGIVRGYLRGLWCPLQNHPLGHGDTFSGTRGLGGKSFLALEILTWDNGTSRGQVFLETSDTWS